MFSVGPCGIVVTICATGTKMGREEPRAGQGQEREFLGWWPKPGA